MHCQHTFSSFFHTSAATAQRPNQPSVGAMKSLVGALLYEPTLQHPVLVSTVLSTAWHSLPPPPPRPHLHTFTHFAILLKVMILFSKISRVLMHRLIYGAGLDSVSVRLSAGLVPSHHPPIDSLWCGRCPRQLSPRRQHTVSSGQIVEAV